MQYYAMFDNDELKMTKLSDTEIADTEIAL